MLFISVSGCWRKKVQGMNGNDDDDDDDEWRRNGSYEKEVLF